MNDNINEKNEVQNMNSIKEEEKLQETIASEDVSGLSLSANSRNGKKKCILNGILWTVAFLAIAGIYLLFFMQGKSPAPRPIPVKSGESTAMIITVNTDSIMAHFTLAQILTEELEKETEQYDKDIEGKSKSFYAKYQNLVDNVQNNRITQTQAENAQRQLGQEQEQLEALQMQYANILQSKSLSVQNEIMDSIKNASSRVNMQYYQADYVFAVSAISAVLYSNEVYDITNEVIEELNAAYKKSTK
jgi:outer membrane protein